MSTIILTPSKRSYSTRGRALGIAKQAISREMNVIATPSGDPLCWTLDNVVVEEAEDGWRWHVEIDMPGVEEAAAEIEEQEQDEAPRDLTLEQALEIAAQQTKAVDEEFLAVEARRKAEAEQKDKERETLQRLLDFNACDIGAARELGREALETSIKRMESVLANLKRRLADFDADARVCDQADRLSWAANDLRNAAFNDIRNDLAEKAGELKALSTARVHIEHFLEK